MPRPTAKSQKATKSKLLPIRFHKHNSNDLVLRHLCLWFSHSARDLGIFFRYVTRPVSEAQQRGLWVKKMYNFRTQKQDKSPSGIIAIFHQHQIQTKPKRWCKREKKLFVDGTWLGPGHTPSAMQSKISPQQSIPVKSSQRDVNGDTIRGCWTFCPVPLSEFSGEPSTGNRTQQGTW